MRPPGDGDGPLEAARRPVAALGVQTGPAGGDLGENLRAASELARSGSATGGLVVFPELFSRPFWCLGMSDPEYFAWAEPVTGPTIRHAAELAAELGSVVVTPFFERGTIAGEYFNSVAVIGPDGTLIAGQLPDGSPTRVYRKNAVSAYRWGSRVNDEKFYFKPGNGYSVFDTPVGRIGILVCLDRWFPEAWRVLALRGAEVVCVVNASQGDVDDLFVPSMRTCAAQNVVFVVAVNRAGVEDFAGHRTTYYGRSCVIDPAGAVLAQAGGDKPEAVAAQLNLADVADVRTRRTMYRDRRPELYRTVCEGPG
jgi:N-carbamoylputrescine amidase